MPLDIEATTTATGTPVKPRRWRLYVWSVLLSLALLGVLLEAFYPSASVPSPPVTLLPLSYKIVPPPPPWPESWIPPTWGWLWRLHDFILGKRKSTLIRVRLFQIDSDMGAIASSLGMRTSALTGPGSVCAWPVSNADWSALMHRLDSMPGGLTIANPQVITGDRNVAKMFVGSMVTIGGVAQPSGLTAEFLPYAVNGMTELTFVLNDTETAMDPSGASLLRTNFAAAARLRMTGADAAVLIDSAEPQAVRKR
ncbi:MAG TPA: hypothetical protein VK731_13545, partial [Candidatus Cybelea sp.]|nr:hypothetical protein [Candidatus Cybelea sp.]